MTTNIFHMCALYDGLILLYRIIKLFLISASPLGIKIVFNSSSLRIML